MITYTTSSTFRRKHDGISSIVNGSSDITGFGTGGSRRLNHALQHLCGHHDGLALLTAFVHNLLLQNGNIFGSTFHTQVTTGDHDSIAEVDNLMKTVTVKAGWLFNLGHDMRSHSRVVRSNQVLNLYNVLRALYK